MSNDLADIRRRISALRARMLELEAEIRRQIARDEDCSANAGRVLDMRAEMLMLIGQRHALGEVDKPAAPPVPWRRYEMTKIVQGMPARSS